MFAKAQLGRVCAVLALVGVIQSPCWDAQLRASTSLLDPLTQPKFVNPLPNPLDAGFIFQPTEPGGSHYEVGIYQFEQQLGLIDPVTSQPLSTTLWGYGNPSQPPTYPGRTFEVQRDQHVTVHWTNNLAGASGNLPHLLPVDSSLHWALMDYPNWQELGVPTVTHLHGGHTRSDSDGLPDAWFTPNFDTTGRLFNETYTYDNDQEAATLWYHDHALGITRLNVYAGLAGFYLVRDQFDTGKADNPLGLPAGQYEVPLVIQDRMFTADGQLHYPSEPEVEGSPDPSVLPEFFGNHILVNGQAWPVLDVEPTEYRFRLLNGSDSRFYNLRLTPGDKDGADSGPQLNQIGTDNGLLYTPVPLDKLTIGPGERADVVVDFSEFADETLILRNNARSPFPKGDVVDPRTTGQIMAFRVGSSTDAEPDLADTLRENPIAPLFQTGETRELLLFEGTDEYGRLQPLLGTVKDGALLWDDEITETPTLNSVEVWEIYNSTEDAHPIHLHLVSFQVLDRQKFKAEQLPETGALEEIKLIGQPKPPAENEAGWKDTVQMFPGEVTRIIAKFDRPGEYVWHCHILSHEDHEMMRPFEVVVAPSSSMVVPEPGTLSLLGFGALFVVLWCRRKRQ